jgi:hypothetical protein
MNLKNAIIWVIAGTGYTLLLKLAHALIPGAFENDHIFFLSKFLMLLVVMGQLFFSDIFTGTTHNRPKSSCDWRRGSVSFCRSST